MQMNENMEAEKILLLSKDWGYVLYLINKILFYRPGIQLNIFWTFRLQQSYYFFKKAFYPIVISILDIWST